MPPSRNKSWGRSNSVPCSGFRSDYGQLAVGLAFAFAGILAMFGLVFNTSLNTREKMKLQTTSDFGALVASNVQRYNLNYINSLNKGVEGEWLALEFALNIPYCQLEVILPCGAVEATYECVAAKVSAYLGANVAIPKTVKPDTPTGLCDSICDQYDNKRQDFFIQLYSSVQTELANSMVTSVLDANAIAYDQALYTFLDPERLPHNLKVELENKLGKGFSVGDVIGEYEKGGMTNADYAYEIMGESKDDPLFIPNQEYKLTPHFNYAYIDVEPVYPTQPNWLCPGFSASIQSPNVNYLPYRITRQTDYTTHYYTGIRYRPPLNLIEETFNLGVRNPDTQDEKFGQNVEGTEGDAPLFQRRTQEVQAVAAAKPYGGTFPEAGIGGYGGTRGDEFTGVKLFGIADSQEIGNQRITRADSCLDQVDNYGNVIGSICYKAEDFLH